MWEHFLGQFLLCFHSCILLQKHEAIVVILFTFKHNFLKRDILFNRSNEAPTLNQPLNSSLICLGWIALDKYPDQLKKVYNYLK